MLGVIFFLVILFLIFRRLQELNRLRQNPSCNYHKWEWDEKIKNLRCQNKGCEKIAGQDSPPGWLSI